MDVSRLSLKLLPIEDVALHEETDPFRVEKIHGAIAQTQALRNPPIVAPRDGGYVLLDGATRTTALRQMGARFLLAQVVNYGERGVSVEAWNHILPNFAAFDVKKILDNVPYVQTDDTTLDEAQILLDSRQIAGYVYCRPGRALAIHGHDGLPTLATMLRGIVAGYKQHGRIYRLAQHDLQALIAQNAETAAVMAFPQFSPKEIADVAAQTEKLPAGITRHIIPGRILNVHAPLDWMIEAGSEKSKNDMLNRWMEQKIVENKVRYYHEPVFLFDE